MSSNKTKNLGLHSWVRSDRFSMDEFNENFDKIDHAIGALWVTLAAIGALWVARAAIGALQDARTGKEVKPKGPPKGQKN